VAPVKRINITNVKPQLLKSAYKMVDGLWTLQMDPELLILMLKAAVEASIFIFFLFTLSELAASLWQVSNSLLRSLP
jgi:hypothetical protein